MTLYNLYPSDMKAINPNNYNDMQDLFVYCWESEESRQAYKDGNFNDHYEQLRIIWINKKLNLGYCIGRKLNNIKYYKIGLDENWHKFNVNFAAQFAKDNS